MVLNEMQDSEPLLFGVYGGPAVTSQPYVNQPSH